RSSDLASEADREGERAPARSSVVDPGAAAVRLRDVLDQREPDAAAAHALLRRALAPEEALEDALLVVVRDPRPLIGDPNLELAGGARDGDGDAFAIGRVLQRVVDEVDHGDLDGPLVQQRVRDVALHLELERDPLALGANAARLEIGRAHV